jgi:hypothetical protein
MKYPVSDYDLIEFEKSRTKNKKYDAILKSKQTGRLHRVPFGDSRYESYQDKTKLNLYPVHRDKLRRNLYRKRAITHVRKGIYSPAHFSFHYLW